MENPVPVATPPTPEGASPSDHAPLLPAEQADRVRRYARLLISLGVAAGALLVTGAVLFQAAYVEGRSGNWVIGGLAILFGAGQLVNGVVRYRQLCRYLATGSGSKYEDLIRAAERGEPPAA